MRIRKNIILMYLIALLQGMVFYGPIATLYRRAAGVGILQITLIESVSCALAILLELPWGVLADRIGYRRTLLWCNFLFFLSKIVFWRADGFAAFLLERVLLSVVMAGLSGVDASVLYLSCDRDRAQGVFGVYNNLGTVGLLGAAGVYSVLIRGDYRLAGLLTAIPYALAAVLTLFLTEVKPVEARRSHPIAELAAIARGLLRDRRTLMLLVAVALLNESHQTITVFLNQLQYVKGGMSDAAIGVVYIAMAAVGLAGGLSARLTGKHGARRAGLILYACSAAACLLLAFTRAAALSVGAILVLRAAFSLYQPLQTDLQNRRVSSENRATALSANSFLMGGVAVSTNLAFGAAAEQSLPGAMLLGAGMCALGLVLFRGALQNAGG